MTIEKEHRGEIKEAAVIGAVLYLGICCDFWIVVISTCSGFIST